ncbi:PspA/IM30 family protein [Membranihabitans marinus]|uniref:PspA/IM30 family protein n=1 Tax=Membranihabitans marinus TaxID=1227546 RepID=UPI001F2D6CEC|nr:hypothetical protein [Membranihabitans marinus]
MSDLQSFKSARPKSFWKKPEGVVGALFISGILLGAGFLIVSNLSFIIGLMANVFYLSLIIVAFAVLLYMVLDPRMRNLVWYMYKSVMRWITGMFIQIDPIGILKSYVQDLEDNLKKMSKQIGLLRGQMRKIKTLMEDNVKEIDNNMLLAQKAKEIGQDNQLLLASRKAARLKESNQKYASLLNKMTVLYKVLSKMYSNSEVLLEDTKDQVKLKEQERKAIRTSYGAMKSAMDIIAGTGNKREMFDAALENIADDLANKVGEMEQFMEMSSSVMDSVDLQNGVFEEQGLKMLEEWEKKSTIMLLGDGQSNMADDFFDLDAKPNERVKIERKSDSDDKSNEYEGLFD